MHGWAVSPGKSSTDTVAGFPTHRGKRSRCNILSGSASYTCWLVTCTPCSCAAEREDSCPSAARPLTGVSPLPGPPARRRRSFAESAAAVPPVCTVSRTNETRSFVLC